MYQKKTLRRFTPEQRKLAESCNDLERTLRRMKKLVETTGDLEHDSRALRNSQKLDTTRKKKHDDPDALNEWENDSVTAKMIKAGERLGI